MAKLSVYVPDDLWKRAQASAENKNPSQLVQEALRRMVGDRVAYVTRATGVDDEVAAVARKKAAEAQDAYDSGWSAGLELAGVWPWDALDWLADFDFDLEGCEEANDPVFFGGDGVDVREWDPSVMWKEAEEEASGRGKLFRLGMRQAFRDVWEAVVSAEHEAADRSDESEISEEQK